MTSTHDQQPALQRKEAAQRVARAEIRRAVMPPRAAQQAPADLQGAQGNQSRAHSGTSLSIDSSILRSGAHAGGRGFTT